MIQNILVKILLAPFSLLYGLGAALNSFFYRTGLLKSVQFNFPVISIGNLSVGGSGKTPHIEYLIRLLKDYLNIATLSRGYGRKTRGYMEVYSYMNAEQAGDEPLQFKRKFPDILAVVGENRAFGIPRIISDHPEAQLILLDDAYQHRAVKPGMNLLLTEYDKPFTRDFPLPSGRLREWPNAYKRADTIIVSKCPEDLTIEKAEALRKEIAPQPNQRLFFSYYGYGSPYYIFNPRYRVDLTQDWDVLLICAIAKKDYLLSYLEQTAASVKVMAYEDHHFFDKGEIGQLHTEFQRLESDRKVILTTEKDATRLELHREFLLENRLPIFALPVEVKFHFDEGPVFDQYIRDFLLNFKV